MPAHTDFPLIPRPSKLSARAGSFTLDADTSIRAAPGTEGAADLLRSFLAPATGLPLPPSPNGQLGLRLDPQLGRLGDEAYGLTITPHAPAPARRTRNRTPARHPDHPPTAAVRSPAGHPAAP